MKAILQCLILGGMLALAACGKDGGGSAAPATAVVTANGCTADQIPTSAGCGVYSNMCQPGQGLVGQTCYAATIPANCGVAQPGVPVPYGCPGGPGYGGQYGQQYGGQYGQQYGGQYNNGYNYNNGYYSGGGAGYYSSGVVYNTQTHTFDPGYRQPYVQPMPVAVPYGYRPYYPAQNGVQVGGHISFSF